MTVGRSAATAKSRCVAASRTTSSAIRDRKSTRLNSSHGYISYAVFCLKKKKKNISLSHCNNTTCVHVRMYLRNITQLDCSHALSVSYCCVHDALITCYSCTHATRDPA